MNLGKPLVAALGALLLTLTLLPAAAARAETTPMVSSPTWGRTVPIDFTGPIKVDLTGHQFGNYTMQVEWYEAGAGQRRVTFTRDHQEGSDPIWQVEVPLLQPGGTVDVFVTYGPPPTSGSRIVSGRFKVAPYVANVVAPAQDADRVEGNPVTGKVRWTNIRPTQTTSIVIWDRTRNRTAKRCDFTGPAAGSTTECTTEALQKGHYYVHAKVGSATLSTRRFQVYRRLEVTGVDVTQRTFYPLVQDGYRDRTVFSWRSSIDTLRNVITVRHSNGVVVRREVLPRRWWCCSYSGYNSWTWDARKDDGTLVGRGDFVIELTSTAHADQTVVRRRTVTVTTATDTVRVTRRQTGWDNNFSSSNCDMGDGRDYDSLLVTCRGGTATIKWSFTLPADARRLGWQISDTEYCCWTGRYEKSGSRPALRRYVVTMKLGGSRSVDIHAVKVSYVTKKRI